MSIRNTILTLGALAVIAAVSGAAAQDATGKPTWRITPSPTLPPLVRPAPNADDAKFVQCPLVWARTEVVSTLPTGWWQTPYEGPLVGTRVEVVSDGKLLVCDYQAYTTSAPVMMKVPASMNCTAVAGGFNCR